MTIKPVSGFQGVYLATPSVHEDERGFFYESFRKDALVAAGIPHEFVQDNHSRSHKGVIRGLHFQWEPPMAKLMRVSAGRAFLVAVDIRPDSPSCGKWFGVEADTNNRIQLYTPAGFARGFAALEEDTEVQYKCTGLYNNKAESGIRYDDPALGIIWPVEKPVLSEKDAKAQTLSEWLERPEAKRFSVHDI